MGELERVSTKKSIDSKINAVDWYHSFELLPGIVTPGKCHVNPKHILDTRYKIPADLYSTGISTKGDKALCLFPAEYCF